MSVGWWGSAEGYQQHVADQHRASCPECQHAESVRYLNSLQGLGAGYRARAYPEPSEQHIAQLEARVAKLERMLASE